MVADIDTLSNYYICGLSTVYEAFTPPALRSRHALKMQLAFTVKFGTRTKWVRKSPPVSPCGYVIGSVGSQGNRLFGICCTGSACSEYLSKLSSSVVAFFEVPGETQYYGYVKHVQV